MLDQENDLNSLTSVTTFQWALYSSIEVQFFLFTGSCTGASRSNRSSTSHKEKYLLPYLVCYLVKDTFVLFSNVYTMCPYGNLTLLYKVPHQTILHNPML